MAGGRSPAATEITVTVSHLSYSVKAKGLAELLLPAKRSTRKDIPILKDINLVAHPGKLTVLIGPSGCGKTTLLNIISGRASRHHQGQVCFNGTPVKGKKLNGSVSYMPAEDRHLPFLTVRETLMFQAILKMPNVSEAARYARVEEVMELLGLQHVADTHIGGSWKKGLSTGEIRRCSIGQELVGDPGVFLLDEPTSGLDAVLAFEVLMLLKHVAKESRRSVLCSLHQPRSAAYRAIDHLCVMSEGSLIYQGSPGRARGFFMQTLGRDICSNGSAADGLIDVASNVSESVRQIADEEAGDSSGRRESGSGKEGGQKSDKIVYVWEDGLAARAAQNFSQSQEHMDILAEIDVIHAAGSRDYRSMVRDKRNPILQWLLEVGAIAFRVFRNQLRNPIAVITTILIQSIAALLLGGVFFDLPHTYLPETTPVNIDDPSSPFMRALESDAVKFITTGIDGTGRNPFVDMIVDGVDGNGASPLTVLSESGSMARLSNVMPCVHRKWRLSENPIYTTPNFDEFKPLWEGWDEPSQFIGGPNVPPQIATTVFTILQNADHAFYEFDYWFNAWRYCRGYQGSILARTLPACMACINNIGRVIAAPDLCTGLPAPPAVTCNDGNDYLEYDDPFAPADVTPADMPSPRKLASLVASEIASQMASRPLPGKLFNRTTLADDAEFVGVADRASVNSALFESGGTLGSGTLGTGTEGGKRRKLQASVILGKDASSLTALLPERLLKLQRTGEEYYAALERCTHPGCRVLLAKINGEDTTSEDSDNGSDTEGSEGSSDSGRTTTSAMVDYASVLGAVTNVAGALFFSVANVGFASYDGLVSVCYERLLFNREVSNRTYRPSSYIVGKSLGDFAFQIIPAAVASTVFFFMINLDPGHHGSRFFVYLGINMSVMFAAYGFSYLVSSFAPSPEVALVAAALVLVILLCCSGFFVRDSAIPAGMTWLKYLSYYRWGFFALMLSQFPSGEFYHGLPNSFNLALAGITEHSIPKCVYVTLGLGVGFRFLAWSGLKFTNTKKGVET